MTGQVAQGSGAPTLEDVARVAGVSRATASRVIRGSEPASGPARERVQAAIRELGYVPNHAARSLASRRTGAVAVVVPEPDLRLFSDPFLANTISGVAARLATAKMQLVLLMLPPTRDPSGIVDYLRPGRADGAIIMSHHRADGLPALIGASHIPVVLQGRPFQPESHVPYVDVDNAEGGRLAARHLLSTGATRLATITGPMDMPAAVDRLAGWQEELGAAGVDASVRYDADFTPVGATLAARRLLKDSPDVDAIFVHSDQMALAVIAELHRAGRSVPGDVRVIGFDDLDQARASEPSLTTLTNPGRDMGSVAADLVLQHIESGAAPASVVFPTSLVVRDSA